MAEEEEVEVDVTDDEELAAGGNAGKKWLLAMLVLLLLGGGAAGAYFFVFAETEEAHEEVTIHKAEDSHGNAAEEPSKVSHGGVEVAAPVFYELPQFLVNLNTGGAKARFLKMKVTVELGSQEDLKIIESYQPRIVDSVNTYLRELRASDLSGSAGMHRLREELMKRINQYISPAEVKNILFAEIVVQ